MAQKSSKKYKSISTGQPCSAAQYAAELVCIRKAERENKGSLGYKFWNNTDAYKVQVRVAHKLIKKYGEEAVIKYLTNPGGLNVYSLGFLHKSKKFVLAVNFVEEGIKKTKVKLDQQASKPKKVAEKPKGEYKSKKSLPNKKSLLSKLRKADGSEN